MSIDSRVACYTETQVESQHNRSGERPALDQVGISVVVCSQSSPLFSVGHDHMKPKSIQRSTGLK
jgi:hypothetical protein